MNVYLLQLTKELGSLGITADVYTRFHDPNDPEIVELGPGARVIHVKAGPWYETKDGIYPLLPEFVENMLRFQRERGLSYDLYHSHYWLSGEVVARLNRAGEAAARCEFPYAWGGEGKGSGGGERERSANTIGKGHSAQGGPHRGGE